MRRRLFVGALLAVVATLAVVAGSYASADGSAKASGPQGKQVLPTAACSSVYYTGRGKPKFIIASDLPLQGANRPQTVQMGNAIRFILKQRKFKAGNYTVGYQSCDDATAQSGKWDSARCASNARSYVSDRSVIGVIGTFNSGCAKLEIPILNRAPGGPVAMVSPSNTAVGLTVSGLGSSPGEPRTYYPTGKRNYIRVVARDDIQGPAGAMLAKSLKVKKVYVLTDRETYGLGVATTFGVAAKRLGLTLATSKAEAWDVKASSYEALANRIKQSGAQAVYLGGIVCNNGGQLIKDLRAALGTGVKLIGPDGWTPFDSVAKVTGGKGEGMYITVPGSPPEALKGPGKKFSAAFSKSQGGKKLQAYTAYAAQSAVVLLDAIAKSNGSRGSVSANLFKTNVKNGILGSFKIDKNGDTNLPGITAYILRGQDGKTFKTFTPPAKLTKR